MTLPLKLNKMLIMALVVLLSCILYAKKPDMYLCAETGLNLKDGRKMVYGYINSEKTDCMPEYEFIELYRKSLTHKKKNLDSISNSEVIRLIQKGYKDLSGGNFQSFDFMGVILANLNLEKADFESADLRNTTFENSNCKGANFSHAFMRKSNLKNANLANAKFDGAYLPYADFTGAKGLVYKMFEHTKSLYNIKVDEAFLKELKHLYPKLFKKPKKCWENNTWAKDVDCDESKDNYPIQKIK